MFKSSNSLQMYKNKFLSIKKPPEGGFLIQTMKLEAVTNF